MIKKANPYGLMITLSLSVLTLWIVSALVVYQMAPDWSTRGTIGDTFGVINSLFSGLAFAALIYTIVIQREEIRINREEIGQNRVELKKSAKIQEQSQKALQEQAKQTHLTAKINAMSTVVNYYNLQINNASNTPELIEKAKQKRRAIIQQIDELIDGLSDSNIDD